MLNNMGVGFIFRATDLATPTMLRMGKTFDSTMRQLGHQTREANGQFKAFNVGVKAMGQAVMGLGAVRIAAMGVAGALNLADAAGSFEQGMAQVAALSGFATDSEEALRLETVALDAAMKTKFSPREATDGLANFASQGFTAAEQATALVPALRLAQAGMIGVEESAAAMTSALKVFGISANDAGIVTDKLLKISNATSLGAGDLELALGTVGRGASAAKQNLDEMLIAMGLVKNTGVDASVAASSVSSALIFMANNASQFQDEFGVSVTDANGKFRDFIDVVMDTELKFAEKFDDEAERVKASAKLYGKFGLTAFQAVSTQINNGITTATGGIVKGREAVEYLRATMKDAEGTAAEFEKTMLGTWEGQKQLLQGVKESLQVALGRPFMELAKRGIVPLRNFLESLVGIINSIPPGVKETIAKVALAVLGLVAAIGALVAAKASIMLAGMALRYIGLSGMIAVKPLLIVSGVLVALGLVFAAFKTRSGQLKDGLGGVFAIGKKIGLFFRGLVQYVKDGELSGPLLDELNLAENEGVKGFLGTVLDIGARIVEFFKGVKEGFSALIETAGPVFVEFQTSLGALGEAVGDFTGGVTGTNKPMAAAQASGVKWGTLLGQVAILLIKVMTVFLKAVTAIVGVFNALGISLGTVVKLFLAYRTAMLAVAAVKLVGSLMASVAALKAMGLALASTSAFAAFAGALTAIKVAATGLLTALAGPAGLVLLIGAAVAALVWWADQKFGFSDEIADWAAEVTGLNEELERLNRLNGGLTETRGFGGEDPFAGGRTAKLAAEQGLSVEQYQQQRLNELAAEGWKAKVNPDTGDVEIIGRATQQPAAGGAPAGGALTPAAAATMAGPPPISGAPETTSAETMTAELAKLNANIDALAKRPVDVSLNVDGEKLGEATTRGQAATQARAFGPLTAE